MFTIEEYILASGISPYKQRFAELADMRATARIYMRIKRLEVGNIGF